VITVQETIKQKDPSGVEQATKRKPHATDVVLKEMINASLIFTMPTETSTTAGMTI
jgi:hypothetical protein